MQDEVLKAKEKQVLSISNADGILKIFPSHPEKHASRRIQKGIRAKLIYTSARGPILKGKDAEALRESKFIPSESFPFNCDFVIYDNIVQISTLREKPVGVIIGDRDIAASMKAVFDLLWKNIK